MWVGDEDESSTVTWSCYSGFLVNHVEQDGALSHTKFLMAEKMRTVIPYHGFVILSLWSFSSSSSSSSI